MSNKKSKTYIGIVTDNKDPKKIGRVKVRVFDVFDQYTTFIPRPLQRSAMAEPILPSPTIPNLTLFIALICYFLNKCISGQDILLL